jgi:hypothetical protein
MADDVQDVYIATEAGDAGWQSLTELTASKVEAKLPIESEDGSVLLESPAKNIFRVHTAGFPHIKLDEIGRFGLFRFDTTNMGTLFGLFDARGLDSTVLDTQMSSSSNLLSATSITCAVRNEAKLDGSYGAFTARVTNSSGTNQVGSMGVVASTAGRTPEIVFVGSLTSSKMTRQMTIDGDGNVIVHRGQVLTPSVSGLRDNDASVTLGDQATLTKGDGSQYVPSVSNSICTKKYCDDNAGGPAYDDTQIKADLDSEASTRAAADTTLQSNIDAKIWVGTSAEYALIFPKLSGTLYCLTD